MPFTVYENNRLGAIIECANCASKLEKGQKFCKNCGLNINLLNYEIPKSREIYYAKPVSFKDIVHIFVYITMTISMILFYIYFIDEKLYLSLQSRSESDDYASKCEVMQEFLESTKELYKIETGKELTQNDTDWLEKLCKKGILKNNPNVNDNNEGCCFYKLDEKSEVYCLKHGKLRNDRKKN